MHNVLPSRRALQSLSNLPPPVIHPVEDLLKIPTSVDLLKVRNPRSRALKEDHRSRGQICTALYRLTKVVDAMVCFSVGLCELFVEKSYAFETWGGGRQRREKKQVRTYRYEPGYEACRSIEHRRLCGRHSGSEGCGARRR